MLVHQDGENPAEKLEKLLSLDNRKTRLTIAGLELVPARRCRQTALAAETEQTFRDRIVHTIRTHDNRELANIQHELWRLPGFSRVRYQIGKATALAHNEWARTRRSNEPWPGWPTFLKYVKKQASKDCGRFCG